jgi:hypothetical protein
MARRRPGVGALPPGGAQVRPHRSNMRHRVSEPADGGVGGDDGGLVGLVASGVGLLYFPARSVSAAASNVDSSAGVLPDPTFISASKVSVEPEPLLPVRQEARRRRLLRRASTPRLHREPNQRRAAWILRVRRSL